MTRTLHPFPTTFTATQRAITPYVSKSRWAGACFGVLVGCAGNATSEADSGAAQSSNSSGVSNGGATSTSQETSTSAAGGLGDGGEPGTARELLGAPLVFAPTAQGFGLSVVLASGDPATLIARVRAEGATRWGAGLSPVVRASDLAEWHIAGLSPSTRYEYEVATQADDNTVLHRGSVTSQRNPGESFTFATITDTHVGAHLDYSNQGDPATLEAVSAAILDAAPDFVVNLGDVLDFHQYGFNVPPPSSSITRLAYLNYRTLLGPTTAQAAHFEVLGGWDGENGCNTAEEVERSRTQRLLYSPGPTPETYIEGGSSNQDYYAFTWGDALFVVLNVYSYTPTCHLLSGYPGLPDDWTLGETQLDWLEQTLTQATSKWRFVLIHHPVGGQAGDEANSAYGRGGGQAAYVGEQATVHELMQEHGVQLFLYGHDHVFTDIVVDAIHYTLPGSAGAPWKFTEAETGYDEYWPESGWARVDVAPEAVNVKLIAQSGVTLHEYTIE